MSYTDEQLLEKLKKLEEIEDSMGWDQLPSLAFLSWDGKEVIVESIGVIDAPSYNNIFDAFYQVAVSPPLAEHSPIAVAFMSEGWTPDIPKGMSKADIKAFMASYPYKRIADDPNRKEVRSVIAISTNGKRYDVSRERGQQPYASFDVQAKADQASAILGVTEIGRGPLEALLNAWAQGDS